MFLVDYKMGSVTHTKMTISPRISKYVDSLIREGRIGVSAGNMRVQDIGTSCSSLTKQPCGDRFKLVIPYAGHTIIWEVLFNHYQPDEPPDFIFGPEDKDFLPNIEDIKSLINWDSSRPDSLLCVVRELIEQYRIYQQKLLSTVSRLQFEYNSLLENNEGLKLTAADVEVHVLMKDKSYDRVGPASFLVKLPIDFSQIPPYLTRNNPGPETAVLIVTFQSPDGCNAVSQLFLSPRVEHALGWTNIRLPAFPSGGCLLDYVPQVLTLLQSKVDQVSSAFMKRKEYISAFQKLFAESVVEYDADGFTKVTYLMEWHDFFFVISIELGGAFPTDQPAYVLQSVYHEAADGKPFYRVIKDYPYSPRWSPKEMADRARQYILDNISNFQKTSVKDGSL